ncbi:MAG: ATP-binding cassette domain-containing protein [Gammaproteobacteria bacterium]|nr:ATP-binding cassette domain-containing protein [Gammaproteobacteria bacterium]
MLLNLHNAVLDLGGPTLLDNIDFQLNKGQRVALLGRNGCGKSTLLKVLAGQLALDSGTRKINQGVTLGYLSQAVPNETPKTVYELIALSFGEAGRLLVQSHHAADDDHAHHAAMSEVDTWTVAARIDKVISQFQLEPEMQFSALSGGRQRRALLASVVATEPDILLLDEPTNHLDLDSVLWLENYLASRQGALLFVSHDREFISRLANRIVELDRGQMHQYDVTYKNYLTLREQREEEEQRHNALFDKKLAQEERWIRQGVQARRTRNEGRVKALKALREDRSERRNKQASATLKLDAGKKSGKLVAEVENINFSYDNKPIVSDFSTSIMRGDKIGLIGPNGIGKTTLLRLLLGDLTPDSGQVKLGTKIEVAYLDQQRSEIDDDKSLVDNVSLGREFIEIDGKSQHIIGYLQEFLFDPKQARARAGLLSGGERARLLLARLFSQPANVLILDEPTNDLDIETLELLEELLLQYQGTLFLVSHDRALLNNVVTSSLVLEGDGHVLEYVGGYDDWLRQRPKKSAFKEGQKKVVKNTITAKQVFTKQGGQGVKVKLSYKDQRELDTLPETIASLEADQDALYTELSSPDSHANQSDQSDKARNITKQLKDIESKLNNAYVRWEQLEAL